MSAPARPRLLVVGGFGGLLGRALLSELAPVYALRTVHRHPDAAESATGVEWRRADAATTTDWDAALDSVDAVVNLAWWRSGRAARFRALGKGLCALIAAAARRRVDRFVQVSVPAAPPRLEAELPYLVEKRGVDRALAESGLSYRIVRPTAMFGRGDVLLGVMLRTIRRFRIFPMFGDGRYHLSPIAASDVAAIIRRELAGSTSGTVDLGGPERFEYRVLTDQMFRLVGVAPHYWTMSPDGGRRLARLLESVGSHRLYAYEVEWLVSDLLGLPPTDRLDRPLLRVGPYLAAEAGAMGHGADRPPASPSGAS